jgi:hypothetical protein
LEYSNEFRGRDFRHEDLAHMLWMFEQVFVAPLVVPLTHFGGESLLVSQNRAHAGTLAGHVSVRKQVSHRKGPVPPPSSSGRSLDRCITLPVKMITWTTL